ncbi:UDP-N-acetylmuramoyl-tripeptide--D-alanyl-D-alanine ligase [Pseudolysinimonas kribbensis]|uniref:UDP-N-acetylmuramoyl-tripeptide--D-alanyl-D-alanine ligase n=1 Tax=Pseudolysinimonas kribbensis TaxID=433641 RepID=A0ABQ6JYP5_9MICO|nr:UDP-N-acetylmuramoyl-tripeptide--D-alanyl-D-alanine ligase [Pseudolysinimonas kribbensis]GMA93383.1 UDP-N-acetylmuramoyl-tripeptide--D-alanyl-D-alanine ligase [Pseudolysinimonas kribbensis]
MIALTLAELRDALGGELVGGDPADVVDGSVHTDSRLVEPGAVFFALPGAVMDGHQFAAAAVANGAALVIAERPVPVDVPVIVVSDGYVALAALARLVVERVRAAGGLRVVAVTGSNGKTTTKNLLRAILEAEGPTVAPAGSFNNHVGAPFTMLRVGRDTRYLIVEMGASAIGDIARLIRIVVPDIGIVLKVGLAHAGGFGGIEQTQQAKSEMVRDLPPTAAAVLNTDDPRVEAMSGETSARVVRFGLEARADVRATDVRATAAGTTFLLHADGMTLPVRLRILGEHHVMNALAALASARELGIPLDRAIAAIETVPLAERWRMELLRSAPEVADGGVTIINDAYNASPDSTAAALKTLAQIAGPEQRTVAVLGHMAELGEYATEEHDRLGRLVVRLNIGQLVVVGAEARAIHQAASLEGSWDGESVFVADVDAAYDLLRAQLRPGDVVLVKSSKSAGLRHLGDRLAGAGTAE